METRAFKSTCYLTKKTCTDGGNPTKKFEWPVTLSNKDLVDWSYPQKKKIWNQASEYGWKI